MLLRKSVKISGIAHTEVMKAVTNNMSEREAEGIQTYIHKRYGAEQEGYPPIVGAGGICDASSARQKQDAGADLLQIYTGYVYRGPSLLREIDAVLA